MRKILALILISLLFVSCADDYENDSELTLVGTVVIAPDYTPIKEALVSITNGSAIVGHTQTGENGDFTLTIDKNAIDETYNLSITDVSLKTTKEYDILGYGQSYYDYGYLILYDSKNPYNLPSFKYNGYTYVVHPLLRKEYGRTQALKICEELDNYDISDWFLPNYDELLVFFESLTKNGLEEYPNGYYCISNLGVVLTKVYDDGSWRFSTYIVDQGEIVSNVLPMAKY